MRSFLRFLAVASILAGCDGSRFELPTDAPKERQRDDEFPASAMTPPSRDAPPQAAPGPGVETPRARAIVSLTFDDTFADQLAAAPLLARHGMRATFYVNSTRIGRTAPGDPPTRYLSEAELHALAEAGHEIGGHTLHHVDLVAAAPDERARQICDDRANLAALGFAPSTFAYPLGRRDAGVIEAARACGYAAARVTNHTGLPYPGALPATPSFEIAAAPSITQSTTLEDMRRAVIDAEEAGGWAVLVMHHVCDSCGSTSAVAPAQLEAFFDWLADRAPRGTAVATIADVVGARASAPPPFAPAASPPRMGNRIPDPSFEDASASKASPTAGCWALQAARARSGRA